MDTSLTTSPSTRPLVPAGFNKSIPKLRCLSLGDFGTKRPLVSGSRPPSHQLCTWARCLLHLTTRHGPCRTGRPRAKAAARREMDFEVRAAVGQPLGHCWGTCLSCWRAWSWPGSLASGPAPGWRQKTAHIPGPCPPGGRLGWNSRLLGSTRPALASLAVWGANQSQEELLLCVSVSLPSC